MIIKHLNNIELDFLRFMVTSLTDPDAFEGSFESF
jgi:hypothetical protein